MTAEDLKAWRYAVRLSEKRAAAALGVPYMTYYNWESGRRTIPPTVPRLCAYVLDFGPAQVDETGRVTGFEGTAK